jgi:putative endonuclease
MPTSHAVLGRIGERLAVAHLEQRGLVVVARNWRAARPEVRGELDVVARDGRALVFAEVKTRRGPDAGGPLAAVTPRKQAQLRRLAAAYLAEMPVSGGEVRFDVVGVSWPSGGGGAQLTHLPGVC